MNENFINTWVPNAELGRTPSLREPIAKRREREGKTFDTSHALAQAIMKGWKKGSPVDCLVISHEFEVMGGIDYNFFPDCLGEFEDDAEAYLFFLEASMEGKRPGLGTLVLTPEQPSQEVVNTFRTPMLAHQDYTVVYIDATAFEGGGTLTANIQVGRDNGIGIFHLLDGDKKLPTEKVPDGIDPTKWNSQESDEYKKALGALTRVWGIFPGESGQITYQFDRGQRFKLCATGDQWSEIGDINAFHAKISVEKNQAGSLEEVPVETSQTPLSEISVVLNDEKSEQEVLLNFRAPGRGYQDYTIIDIDTTAFEGGGVLIVDIRVGNAKASGSFDLFDSHTELPTEGIPEALVSAWGIKPDNSGIIRHRFEGGTVFKLGATGDWFSKKGNINAFQARISVEAAD